MGLKCVAVEVNATGSSKAPLQQEGWLGTGPSTATSLVSPLTCTKPGDQHGVSVGKGPLPTMWRLRLLLQARAGAVFPPTGPEGPRSPGDTGTSEHKVRGLSPGQLEPGGRPG